MWVGSWEYTSVEGTTECDKVGQYMVNCRSVWTTASGDPRDAVFIIRFDPETEMLMGYRFYNSGYADSGFGWVDGNTSVFVYELAEGARARITQTWSGNTITYVWHSSVEGGPWEQTSEGSTRKVG